jgi:methyl-accepting chemotaxis protein
MVARLLVPVALMLCLVCLLSLVGLVAGGRLDQARAAVDGSQAVRFDLAEVRSLSRSLQRDALNLLFERDRAELALIQGKFGTRSREMRELLDNLVANPRFEAGNTRGVYLRSQSIVLDRLKRVSDAVSYGDRPRALAIFREEVRPNERLASRVADTLIADQQKLVEAQLQRTRDLSREEFTVSLGAGMALFLVAAMVTLTVVRRSVVTPLSDIEQAMTRISAGDTEGRTPHVDRIDEIGRMARAIEIFRASMLEREKLQAENAERRTRQIELELTHEQKRRAAEQAEAARDRRLGESAQALEAEAAEALDMLRTAARKLSTTSAELAGHAASSTEGLGEVRSAVSRAATGATDIAAATDRSMRSMAIATDNTSLSADLSVAAAAQTALLAAQMVRVEDGAREIGNVADLIRGIARQTNLLALNASIEAARAGEVGRGFAIVASEIKQLAQQTEAATGAVAAQIGGMQEDAENARASLDTIGAMIAEIAQGAGHLATSMNEQAQSGEVINRNVSAAANDLDMIGGRVLDVSAAAVGVNELARKVRNDAGSVEHTAAAIDQALGRFFGELHRA